LKLVLYRYLLLFLSWKFSNKLSCQCYFTCYR